MATGNGNGLVGAAIDIHAHWSAPQWLALIEKEGAANGAKIGRDEKGQMTFAEPNKPRLGRAFPRSASDLDMRLKAMDGSKVRMEALSLAKPWVYWAPPAFGLKLAQAYNDGLSETHLKWPDRFVGLATLPMQAPELAVQEVARASKLPGIRGVYIATHVNGVNLDDKTFWPVYAKCQDVDVPVFLHPSNTVGRERMRSYHLVNFLGNPFDTAIAASSLVFGGVLDAYPKLNVVLAHAGGAFPALVGRMDHGITVRPETKHMAKPASDYLRRFHYDTITHSAELLSNLIRQVGADRVVLGSDHPAGMGYKQPVEMVEGLSGLSEAERAMILGGNAARLLKLAA